MRDYLERYLEHFLDLCKNRIFVMLCGIVVMFSAIALRLFSLQIVHGEEYRESVMVSTSRQLNVPASRGGIYDRYGRPLAVNRVAYSVQVDGSITRDFSTEERRALVSDLVDYLWENDGMQTNSLPITSRAPYSFTFTGTAEERELQETRWKTSIGLKKKQLEMTAGECLDYLSEYYSAPETLTPDQKRTYLSLCMSGDRNIMALTIAMKLSEFEETFSDELPLDRNYPYSFQFNDNAAREKSWKESMQMEEEQLQYDSLQTLDYLRDYFGLPAGLPEQLTRDTLGIRYSLFLKRYQQFQSATIATVVSEKTLAYVEENQDIFPGVTISTVSLREYPQGKYFSHILGYIRQMTESDYPLYKDDLAPDGSPLYTATDIVGQDGMERLYERQLNGIDGKVEIEVDSQGRRMSVIDVTDPIAGKDLFLTLDSALQKTAFDALENQLKNAIVSKLTSTGKNAVSTAELYSTMISANHISASKLMRAEGGEQHALYERFLASEPEFDPEQDDAVTAVQNFLLDGVSRGTIPPRQLILIMAEQGVITLTDEERSAVASGALGPLTVILNKLESGDLTPGETALDPSTGSVFVSQVGSGQVLASVAYPSYDNNELVNTFNNSYYNSLLEDTNTPLVNRPLKQKKAPGSTFKMISALAGLETGTITANTVIQDKGIFTDTGFPYARCWIYSNTGGNHGSVTVAHALEVSCNYFFYELAYRMGNSENGGTIESITTLNEYMAAFGLNTFTGLELDEYGPTMASPYNKERAVKTLNPDASTSRTRWTDGDTIRTAIGQSVNSYTPAQITKYISTLANGGTLYKLHMVDHIQNADGSLYQQIEETKENVTTFQEENLQTVYEGMWLVAYGSSGLLRHQFDDLPVQVAVKTGTAEEDKNRSSHTWFVCFAPYDDPQIAITVMIPFGEGSGALAQEVAKAIIREYLGLDYQPQNTAMQTILAE